MPGYTDKSRQYLRLAVENYKRADATDNPELKARFMKIAAEYRDLALEIDDPAQWRTNHLESVEAEAKRK